MSQGIRINQKTSFPLYIYIYIPHVSVIMKIPDISMIMIFQIHTNVIICIYIYKHDYSHDIHPMKRTSAEELSVVSSTSGRDMARYPKIPRIPNILMPRSRGNVIPDGQPSIKAPGLCWMHLDAQRDLELSCPGWVRGQL